MTIEEVLAEVTFTGAYSDADKTAIKNAITTAFNGSATFKTMIENWLATAGNGLDFVFEANDAFVLQVAFNYGGQADIVDAARRLAREVADGGLSPDDIDEARFAAALSTRGATPDLIIRTSGEHRLSNFLLWEAAYAEFIFQDVLWPDYGPEHLKAAVDEFHGRERRFGGIEAKVAHAAG